MLKEAGEADKPTNEAQRKLIEQEKQANKALFETEITRLQPDASEAEIKKQLKAFDSFSLDTQTKTLDIAKKAKTIDDFNKLGKFLGHAVRINQLNQLQRKTGESDQEYFERVVKDYITTRKTKGIDSELAVPIGYKTATTRAQAFDKILKKRTKEYEDNATKLEKELQGKGLIPKKRGRKMKGGKLQGAGWLSDKFNKAIEIGKKAVDIGKTVYEVGKKGYEVGKQVHGVAKEAQEAYKKFKGEKKGGVLSAAGLEKKKRGRPPKGGMMSGGVMSGGVLSAASLEGGAVSRGGYSLALPNPKSARATYQSYF